jgi:hypothetical protein
MIGAGIALAVEVVLCILLSTRLVRPFAHFISNSWEVADTTTEIWRSIDWCYAVGYSVSTLMATVLLATRPTFYLANSLLSNLLWVLPWTIVVACIRDRMMSVPLAFLHSPKLTLAQPLRQFLDILRHHLRRLVGLLAAHSRPHACLVGSQSSQERGGQAASGGAAASVAPNNAVRQGQPRPASTDMERAEHFLSHAVHIDKDSGSERFAELRHAIR